MNHRLIHFTEIQYQPWWLRLIMVGFGLFLFLLFYRQVIQGMPVGNQPVSNLAVILLWLGVGIALPVIVIVSRLETTIDQETLRFRYVPFQLSFRTIDRHQIIEARLIQYRPLRDYGGWGIRWGKQGTGYTVSGNSGVQVTVRGRRTILLGTQRGIELVQVLGPNNQK